MRLASAPLVLSWLGLGVALVGCPGREDKSSPPPVDKAEPEMAQPDEEVQPDAKPQRSKPLPAATSEDKKDDDGKSEGGY